jgi:hypothetical protein
LVPSDFPRIVPKVDVKREHRRIGQKLQRVEEGGSVGRSVDTAGLGEVSYERLRGDGGGVDGGISVRREKGKRRWVSWRSIEKGKLKKTKKSEKDDRRTQRSLQAYTSIRNKGLLALVIPSSPSFQSCSRPEKTQEASASFLT